MHAERRSLVVVALIIVALLETFNTVQCLLFVVRERLKVSVALRDDTHPRLRAAKVHA